MRSGEYADGVKNGLWTTYYANGNKMSEGSYTRGRKDGPWIQYWPNGNKKSEATFSNGHYTGLYTCWFENGFKQWEGWYNPIRGNSADGTKEGVWLAYDKATGEVYRTMTYHRGSRAKPDEYAPFKAEPVMGPKPE